MTRQRTYNVFRLVNERRMEIYLAATPHSVIHAIAEIRDRRPRGLHGWKLDDISSFESLEFELPEAAAVGFMKLRILRGRQRGYRYIVAWPDGGRRGAS